MTFIAKAMNKQTRYDAESERAARGAAEIGEAGSGSHSNAIRRPTPSDAEVEFIPIGKDSSSDSPPKSSVKSSAPDPRATARTLSGTRSRKPSKSPAPVLEFMGTLESLPSEPIHQEPERRPWWREPMLIGGSGLGIAALLLGFLISPSDERDAVQAGQNEIALQTLTAAGAPEQVQTSGNKPVVVRVQIDSGEGGSVAFETDSKPDSPPARVIPAMSTEPVTPAIPQYFEPLQPLELPPPPSMDLTVDDPVPSIPRSSSRYETPPPSGDSINDYTLEGIFWSETDPGAIINDEIVSPGSRVDQLRVLEIQKDHVSVQLHGRTYDLR